MDNEEEVEIPFNFEPREYQKPFLWEVRKAMRGESDIRFFYQIWHRRSGKDKTNIADVAPRKLIQEPCSVKYVYPTLVMGREHLWEGIGKDGFQFINHIPKSIRTGEPNDTRMTIKVRNESDVASIFQVAGTNHPDSLRGGNPKLFIFSEWAEHDPYALDVIEPILKENNGIAIFNTTPKGNNHARSLFEYGKTNPLWWVQTLTYKDTNIFTDDQYKQIVEDTVKRFEADGRSSEEAIAYCDQEYMCSFNSPVIGSYYGAAIRKAEDAGRVTNVPQEQSLPVDTHWDLGIDDSMTIWFTQDVGQEIHLIDYYENSGEGLSHYALKLQEKKYLYRNHFAPHDISVRELGTGKSRLEVAKGLGINFQVGKRLEVDDGINAGRMIFNQCWFDKTKCYRGIQALKNYRKSWDEKNKVFRPTPLHDWASHGADAFRVFAVSHGIIKAFKMPSSVGGIKPFFPGIG